MFVLLAAVLALVPGSRPGLPAGFKLDGTNWSFKDDKSAFEGILVMPDGKGPFPAVVICHGRGSNAKRFALPKAQEWAKKGWVAIGVNLTHGDAPGDAKDFGASAENIRRVAKCLDFLESRPGVDKKRFCLYGNSMGAFLVIGAAAELNERIAAAAITAGGISPRPGFPAPSAEVAGKIKKPLLILHGTADTTVPPERSAGLEEILKKNSVPVQRDLFDGVGHNLHDAEAAAVNAKIVAWFDKHAAKK